MSDMYYYNNDFDHNSDMESQMPPEKPDNRKKKSGKGFGKKVGAVALSAVLFGGVAAGTFQGVNYLTSYSTKQTKTTTASTESSLLKATSTTSGTGSTNVGSLDVSGIAESAMPSIVSITSQSVQEVQNYFSMFGNGQVQQQEVESAGSGIIIGQNDTELLVVTNNHVVEGASTLSVCFVDNEAYEANIKGTDSTNDLAVVAVPLDSISSDTMSQIKVATMGSSDNLKVGEQVVAIGNALGYGQSVTTGIVSAKDRLIDTNSSEGGVPAQTTESRSDSTTETTYIQTDAAINPGNSGGALLNMNGEVIGINSAKMSSTDVEGMGYAIPVDKVSETITNLMNKTTRTKVAEGEQAALGIKGVGVDSEVQQVYGIPEGVYVGEVTAGGAAANAGITANCVITSFDGTSVTDITALKDLLQYYKAGEQVDVTAQVPDSNGYSEKTYTVTLGKADSSTTSETEETQESQDNGSQYYGSNGFFGDYGNYGNGYGDQTTNNPVSHNVM